MNGKPQFDYAFFTKILNTLKKNFLFSSFQDAAKVINYNHHPKPFVLLRHDVDLDLSNSLRIALIEKELDIRSCFMVMTNSPFYSLDDNYNKSIITDIINSGHEIGLHFNFDNNSDRNDIIEIEQTENKINNSCENLEAITGSKINSISFHRPLPQFLRGPFYINGRVNAYSAELMRWYLSDSKGNWREGDPIDSLAQSKNNVLQLLMHPIWWDDKHLDAPDRLQTFFENRTVNFSVKEKNKFDNLLSSYLTIQRSRKDT